MTYKAHNSLKVLVKHSLVNNKQVWILDIKTFSQQNFNKDQLGFLSNILQGIPIQPNRTSNFQNYNPMQQALGAGIAGLGLYRGMM